MTRHAFEDVEVDVLVMRLGRDGTRGRRVPDDHVGVGADGDAALARVNVENLGRIRAGHRYELTRVQLA